MMETLVIVGAGQAAGQAVATLRQKGYDGKIVLIGDEPHLPYQRPPLSKKFLSGELEAPRLLIKPEDFYARHNVELRLNQRVAEIDRDKQTVELSDKNSVQFDKLLLATGSRVRKLPIPGADLDGIHYLRNIADVKPSSLALSQGKTSSLWAPAISDLKLQRLLRKTDLMSPCSKPNSE